MEARIIAGMSQVMPGESSKFKGQLAISCATFIVLIVACIYGVLKYLPPRVTAPDRYYFAVPSGGLIALALFSIWGIVRGGAKKSRSRAELFRRAESGDMPTDGEPIVVQGKVRPAGAILRAPFSGVECVGYEYRLYFFYRNSRGHRNEAAAYWGYASQPFTLDGIESKRVTAFPSFTAKGTELQGPEAFEAAKRWVETTRFEEVGGQVPGAIGAAIAQVRERLTDDDGVARRDSKLATVPELNTLHIEETVLRVGDEVSAYGTWSEMRGAIVAGDGMNGTVGVSVTHGPMYDIPRQTLPSGSLGSFIWAIFVELAIAVGLVEIAEKVIYPPM